MYFTNQKSFMTILKKLESFNIQQIILLTVIFCLMSGTTVFAQQDTPMDSIPTLSPLDFGLAEAKNDRARYEVLYNTHSQALKMGANVSYEGIDTLTISISNNARPIPLTRHTDFGGAHIIVKNSSKTQFLFEMKDEKWQELKTEAAIVDSGDFASVKPLESGLFQVLLEDEHLWVNNRKGYDYGATRRDILLVQDGCALNHPVAPYSTDSTLLKAKFHATDDELKTIANLTITRDTSSTFKTYCFNIAGINNLKVSNVKIKTPATKNMYADSAINIANCTNIFLEDVDINGTYSRTNLYGYGIHMDNVWKSQFTRLSARANWGIFGTNNLSNTTLLNCNINRFDIHCYGRDVYIYNCQFNGLYNQFSSLYGELLYDGCRFNKFLPVLIETSYNAYTPFNLTFRKCTFNADPSHQVLVSIGYADNNVNSRPELKQKCWPNVTINDMTVNIAKKTSKVILFQPKGTVPSNFSAGYISSININGLTYVYADTSLLADFVIVNSPISSKKSINYDLRRINLIPSTQKMMKQSTRKFYYPGSLTFNLRRNKNDQINIALSRINYNIKTNSQYNIHFTNCTIGMIRYNSNSTGTKRKYNQCTLYLNNCDDGQYYIDNQAVYTNCLFIPCNSKMFISFYGNNNDVVIKNCRSQRKSKLFYKGSNDNAELNGFEVKGNKQTLR